MRRPAIHRRRDLAAGVGLVALLALAGCQKPLFPANSPRTQFDRFDEVRNQSAPQYVQDEFGRRRPNIKGRLEPKG
jgi:hypothetical protein